MVPEGFGRRSRSALARRFGVDTRALAAFRVALGVLVLSDLAMRARHLTAFYTDAGVHPRSTFVETYPTLSALSVHTVTGSARGQAALFVLTAAVALALLVGYRTRLAAALTWYLLLSLYLRNPYVLNGGDGLLILSLLFGAFLLQLVVIYVANAGFKLQGNAWTSGRAVRYVLALEQFSVRLGPHVTAFPELLVAANWLWVAMLLGAPLLVVATGWRRTLVVAPYVCAHLVMLSTLRLGLFPLVTVAMLSAYLPSSVWDRVEEGVAAPVAGRAGRLEDRLRGLVRREPRLPASVRRAGRVAAPVVVATLLVGSVAWPAASLGVVEAPVDNDDVETDGYVWRLFAPNPPTSVRWVVAPATLETGETVDALDGSAVEWDPPDAADTYPSALWHRYFNEMRSAGAAERRPLGTYLCRRGVPERAASVESVSVYLVEEPLAAAGGGDRRQVEVVSRECEPG